MGDEPSAPGSLHRRRFNADDGLDQVELALIAGEFASSFDADGDGYTTVDEIASQARSRVGPGLCCDCTVGRSHP